MSDLQSNYSLNRKLFNPLKTEIDMSANFNFRNAIATLPLYGLRQFTFYLVLLALTLCIAACDQPGSGQSEAEVDAVITAPDIPASRLLDDISMLASDEFEGRAPMSAGEALTLDFIEQRFRDLGLEPMFEDSYRQPVPLVSITTAPNAALTITPTAANAGEPLTLNYDQDVMLWSQRPEEQLSIDTSELVFVGYGVVAPEYDWNDYAGVDVTGKTVIILVNDPGFATGNNDLFEGRTMTYYGRWSYKFEEAARQGAAAALIVHDTEPASYPWAVVSNSWSGSQFHVDVGDDGGNLSQIEGWLTHQAAAQVLALAGENLTDLETAAKAEGFTPQPLALTASSQLEQTVKRNQSYNIGAKISGSEQPDQWFVYMAHWDHIGKDDTAAEGVDNIYNGAVDNATGVAGVLALAESFAAQPHPPQRTVGFVAVTAEESGLLGSAHYANNPPLAMGQHVAGVNIDAMNVYGPTRDLIVVGYGKSQMEDYLRKHADEQQRTVAPEDHPEAGYFYRSDHFNFAKNGVPVLYAKSGSDHTEHGTAWMIQKQKDFTANRYHKAEDEVLDDWDLSGMQQDLKLFFNIGWDITNTNDWPEWYPGNEFKAIRDQSRQ